MARISRYDPTRTLTLRNRFASKMSGKFNAVKTAIRQAVVDQDCFGLRQEVNAFQQLPGNRAFAFTRSADKVDAFMDWLNELINQEVLETYQWRQLGQAAAEPWTNLYIRTAYQRGLARARAELNNSGYDVPSISDQGGIGAAFNHPFHVDRAGLIFTRVFSDLRGITNDMETKMSRVLSRGLMDGLGPREIAKNLLKVIDGTETGDLGLGRFMPAKRRAIILARTEVIRAHHLATIQEYRNWGAVGVRVQAEWTTAGDARVCSQCAELEGRIYTLDEIEDMIPIHPQCRCVGLPVEKDIQEPQTIQDEVDSDPVASLFGDRELGKKYLEYKRSYLQQLDNEIGRDRLLEASEEWRSNAVSYFDSLVRLIEQDRKLQKHWDIVYDWQSDTQKLIPTAFKLRAYELETRGARGRFFGRYGKVKEYIEGRDRLFGMTGITTDIYLRIRAFNQAYMELIGVDSIMLYRGTGGSTGRRLRKALTRSGFRRKSFKMVDNVLTGYSTNEYKVWLDYGMDGIAVRRTFDVRDIVIHKDLISGITTRYWEEEEYIVKGIKEKVNIKDVKLLKPDGTLKDYGEEL